MTKVTDPALLAQLNGTKVTDPAILAQLNGTAEPEPGLGKKLEDRATSIAKTAFDPQSTALDTAAASVKQGSGAVGDVVQSIASEVTPGFVKKLGKEAVSSLANTRVGRAAQYDAQKASEFGGRNPSIGKPASAVASVIGAEAGTEGLEAGGKLAAKGTASAAKTAEKNILGAKEGVDLLREGMRARTPEMLANATENIAREGHQSFDAMRKSGVSLPPKLASALAGKIQGDVAEMGVLNPQIHGSTISILKQMKNDAQNGMSVEKLHQYRKLLRGAEKKELRAGNDEGALAAQRAIGSMDQAIEDIKIKGGSEEGSAAIQSMQNGIKTWAKMRKFDTISDAVERANGDPDKLKTALKKIYDSDKLSRGFTKEEKAALKAASENTTAESLLKMVGKFGFDISKGVQGNKAPFWAGVGAHLLGAPTPGSVALMGAGTAARYGQKLAERAKTERLLKLIEGNKVGAEEALGAESDPLAQQIQNQQRRITK